MIIRDMRFLCCTMWTDFQVGDDAAYAQISALRGMNDYRYIRMAQERYRRIRPVDTAEVHADHRNWLQGRLTRPFAGRTVVITHHCPHPDLIGHQAELAAVYGSDLLSVIALAKPDAWFFGHTHHRGEALEGGSLVRNVSLGYPWEVRGSKLDVAEILLRGLLE